MVLDGSLTHIDQVAADGMSLQGSLARTAGTRSPARWRRSVGTARAREDSVG
jgi:hypothetical protein